jgi:hypothetical protein
MSDQSRLFEAGPDPFGRMWNVQFRWLQTGISIRHANTVDVKFFVTPDGGETDEKVISLPHDALLRVAQERSRKLSDPYCMRIAAAHLRRMIETSEDMEKTLVSVIPEQLAEYDQQLNGVTLPQYR